MLLCSGLDFYYGSVHRLKNLALAVPNESLIGLFGHNGAGKSTLLRMLGGSLPIHHGDYSLDSESALDTNGYLRSDWRRQFGVLLEGTSSDDKLSAYQNLVYSARLMGVSLPLIEDAAISTLKEADLYDRAHEPLKRYSHGMRRRLELYRTFMHKPKVVLLDEPTAALDVGESTKFMAFLKQYRRETKASIIMSTHRPDEVMQCERVIMMKDGRIVSDQPPLSLVVGLDYLLVLLTLADGIDALELFPYLYEAQRDEAAGLIRAKLPRQNLDGFLKSPLLRGQQVRAFSVEQPTVADAYKDMV